MEWALVYLAQPAGMLAIIALIRLRFVDPGSVHRLVPDASFSSCAICHVLRPPGAHHCRICNACVAGFDHHCWYTGRCIGSGNRCSFVFLLWCGGIAWSLLATGAAFVFWEDAELSEWRSQSPATPSWWQAIFVSSGLGLVAQPQFAHRYFPAVIVAQGAVALDAFCLYQLVLIACGETMHSVHVRPQRHPCRQLLGVLRRLVGRRRSPPCTYTLVGSEIESRMVHCDD